MFWLNGIYLGLGLEDMFELYICLLILELYIFWLLLLNFSGGGVNMFCRLEVDLYESDRLAYFFFDEKFVCRRVGWYGDKLWGMYELFRVR